MASLSGIDIPNIPTTQNQTPPSEGILAQGIMLPSLQPIVSEQPTSQASWNPGNGWQGDSWQQVSWKEGVLSEAERIQDGVGSAVAIEISAVRSDLFTVVPSISPFAQPGISGDASVRFGALVARMNDVRRTVRELNAPV